MEAEKYLKEQGGAVNIHIEPNDAVYIKEDCTYRLMEEYHQTKLKLLGIANVSKCASEVIKYIENDAEVAMPVNELMHEDGRHLTKKEYGHVLLKYLIVELKERFC